MRRRRVEAGAAVLALASAAATLHAQSRATTLVNSAYAQIQARNVDSAGALVRPVIDSLIPATPFERAAALVLLGLVDFYRGRDSSTAADFRAALALTLDLRGDWLGRVDSTLGTIWQAERHRAVCASPGFDSLPGMGVAPAADSLTAHVPRVVAGPRLEYPWRLRNDGVQGRVTVAAVIDTVGRVERGSVKIVSSPHQDFSREALHYAQNARFEPGRVRGQAVRVCILMPIDFKISGR